MKGKPQYFKLLFVGVLLLAAAVWIGFLLGKGAGERKEREQYYSFLCNQLEGAQVEIENIRYGQDGQLAGKLYTELGVAAAHYQNLMGYNVNTQTWREIGQILEGTYKERYFTQMENRALTEEEEEILDKLEQINGDFLADLQERKEEALSNGEIFSRIVESYRKQYEEKFRY